VHTDDEIQVSICIDIRERHASDDRSVQRQTRSAGDILEAPPPEVPVQSARDLGTRQEQIHEAIAVHVTERDTRTLGQDAVLEPTLLGNDVLEGDPAPPCIDAGESLTTSVDR
jgi:hypothetical protein